MKLRALKVKFSEALFEVFPSEEIQSFFVILSEKYLGLTRLEIAMQPEFVVSEVILEKFTKAMLRLKQYEPIQYILGETEFYSLRFKVNEHTLIPRPETEELVDWIVSESSIQHSPYNILDIGTGSGCIAISLAKNVLNANVSALDISEEGLKIAKENAQIHEVAINFFQQDIFDTTKFSKKYNVIVSNPPYVRVLEKEQMQQNVLNHEPATALFVSNDDPLVFYRKIAKLAQRYLTPNGLLYFEINEYLSKDLVTMLKDQGFSNVVVKKDIFGKDRMIRCASNG